MPRQPKHSRLSDKLKFTNAMKRSPALRNMLTQLSSKDNLAERFDECLPEPLRGKFVVSGITNRTLLLLCPSASLATRFRFDQDRILKSLQMRIGANQVTEIVVKIRPGVIKAKKEQRAREEQRKVSNTQSPEERLNKVLERLDSHSNTQTEKKD